VVRNIFLGGSVAASVPPRPMGAVLSPDGAVVYVSNGRAKSVSVIDAARFEVTRTIEDVGLRPWGIDVGPDGQTLFTANGPSGDVSVVDVASGVVRRRIALGGSPWGVVTSTSK
jgi:YVTN family beta-propeller protein